MRAILHVVTRPQDALPADLAALQQQALKHSRVKVLDLSLLRPDYDALLEEIFAADSVQVW